MKKIRKWSRILHRDIGFFFIGLSLIYGLSGIALNHLKDWNPNYSVDTKIFKTEINLNKSENTKENVLELLDVIDDRSNYKKHYFPQSTRIKIFLKGGSSVVVDTDTGEGIAEFLSKRQVFYMVNFLHYNPTVFWMWFSDVYAAGLMFLAITALFIVKGKKGAWGRGGIYAIVGILIPIVYYLIVK